MWQKMSVVSLVLASSAGAATYEPTWESIDSRPNPAWFSDAKFGIFIHWGVYSVPAWGPKGKYSEWYWHDMQKKDGETWQFHEKTYGADTQYQDFAPLFKAEMFDPDHWADIFKRSGAKYVVLTSKHHEGFCLWPSQESWNWNSVDIGPHRDLAGDLTTAVKNAGLKMGFYYSFYEWFNPLYRSDVHRYVDQHMLPQLKDLVLRYEPSLVWPDGEWDHPSEVWRSTEFLAWLFNESPVKDEVAINDRWGKDSRSRHGGFYTTEYGHYGEVEGTQKDWEECRGIGASFGYNRNETIDDYSKPEDLIKLLVETVAHGGNLLLDIGPTADGRIPVIMEQRLLQIGQWLDVNGEAIYGTQAWREHGEGENVRYTAKDGNVYAICLNWPGETLTLAVPKATNGVQATLLGVDGPLEIAAEGDGVRVTMPGLRLDQAPCEHAYVIKLTGVE
jgi:alpha-L-fucosidase